jgi:hypothetical protein
MASINWRSVSLSVLGDPNALAAYLPFGAWLSDTGQAATVSADAAISANGGLRPDAVAR